MKPVYLELCGFGPYRETARIPFEQLGKSGVFLICGDTGSGKTTIFDGLCYALFGEASGEYRGSDSFRSDFAPEETDTYVYLEFEHRGRRYRLRRSPSYYRAKKRGTEGVTLKKPEACLCEPEGEPLTGPAAVTARVEELLGLSVRQFKQIFMIAQGEFQKLLLSDSADRGEIFRRIFGTDQYRRLQRELKDRYLEEKRQYDSCREQMLGCLSEFSCEPGDPLFQAVEGCRENLFRLPELFSALEVWMDREKIQYQVGEKEMARLQKKLSEFKVLSGLLEEKKTLAEKVQRELSETEEAKKRVEEKKKQAEKHLAATEAREPERRACRDTLLRLEAELPLYEELEALSQSLLQSRREFEAETERKEQLSRAEERFQRRKQYRELLEKQKGALFCLQKLLDSRKKEEEAGRTWKEALGRKEASERAYLELERAYFNGQAGLLAGRLTEGQPCPVCGSTVHPSPAPGGGEIPDESQVQRARDRAGKDQEVLTHAREAFLERKAGREQAEAETERALALCEPLSELPETEQARLLTGMLSETERELALLEAEAIPDTPEALCREREDCEKRLQESLLQAEKLSGRVSEKKKGLRYGSKEEARRAIVEQEKTERTLSAELEKAKAAVLQAEREAVRLEAVCKEKTQLFEEAGRQLLDLSERWQREGADVDRTELEEGLSHLIDAQKKRFHRLQSNQRAEKRLRSLEKQRKDLEHTCSMIKTLSDTANGELSGRQKVALEQYVQGFYLDQVLAEANKRLFSMTSGRYELCRRQEASDKKAKAGLELNVMDYYSGRERAVKTLSGGECFKAALAMALGFSDVIQSYAGGICVDALFIDEGFGSLDETSLEQALTVLRELSDGEKMIGVISHVAELRERLPAGIEVRKSQNGSQVLIGKAL